MARHMADDFFFCDDVAALVRPEWDDWSVGGGRSGEHRGSHWIAERMEFYCMNTYFVGFRPALAEVISSCTEDFMFSIFLSTFLFFYYYIWMGFFCYI